MIEIAFTQFRDLLLEATKNAVRSVQLQHSHETFYAFSLFHEPLWGYIIATANTEEGLTRRAQDYKEDKYNLGYAQMSIEKLQRDLRWSPADWDYHDSGSGFFHSVNQWLREHDLYDTFLDEHKDDFSEDEIWEMYDEQIDSRMISICRGVLATCDREGIFTIVSRRTGIIVNIMMGDQDGSWIEHAQILNPPEVYRRWLSELKAAKRL